MNVVDRFLEYVKFDTQSDELTNLTPSTPGQMVFAQYLEEKLNELGLKDVSLDENGYLMATLPGNCAEEVPTIGFIAHLDTSPDMSGRHVNPRIVKNYDISGLYLDRVQIRIPEEQKGKWKQNASFTNCEEVAIRESDITK